ATACPGVSPCGVAKSSIDPEAVAGPAPAEVAGLPPRAASKIAPYGGAAVPSGHAVRYADSEYRVRARMLAGAPKYVRLPVLSRRSGARTRCVAFNCTAAIRSSAVALPTVANDSSRATYSRFSFEEIYPAISPSLSLIRARVHVERHL